MVPVLDPSFARKCFEPFVRLTIDLSTRIRSRYCAEPIRRYNATQSENVGEKDSSARRNLLRPYTRVVQLRRTVNTIRVPIRNPRSALSENP